MGGTFMGIGYTRGREEDENDRGKWPVQDGNTKSNRFAGAFGPPMCASDARCWGTYDPITSSLTRLEVSNDQMRKIGGV